MNQQILMIESLLSTEMASEQLTGTHAGVAETAHLSRAALMNPNWLLQATAWFFFSVTCIVLFMGVALVLVCIKCAPSSASREAAAPQRRQARRLRTSLPSRRLLMLEREGPQDGIKKCVVCMTHDVTCVCVPCGHLGLCVSCSRELGLVARRRELEDYSDSEELEHLNLPTTSRFVKCPTCSEEVTAIVRTYPQEYLA